MNENIYDNPVGNIKKDMDLIIKYLRDDNYSLRQISKIFNIPFSTISQLNQGKIKRYKRDDIKYPIRPF